MRLGRGLWVGGGFGIFIVYGLVWVFAAALATAIMVGFVIVCAIGFVIRLVIEYRKSQKKRQVDVALFQRITAQRVQHVEYLRMGRTEPPALWGVYLIEPSHGAHYAKCGQYPGELRKLWLENRCGVVRGLIVLPDKPMAVAFLELLQRGVCHLKPGVASIVGGFTANGMPILRNAQP
jgi:hypothetical protein